MTKRWASQSGLRKLLEWIKFRQVVHQVKRPRSPGGEFIKVEPRSARLGNGKAAISLESLSEGRYVVA